MYRFCLSVFLLLSVSCCAQSAFTVYNTENSVLPSNTINKLYFDETGNTWIATENGLVKIDTTNAWTIYNTANSGLPDNFIRSVFVDDNNTLWVGTFLGGLATLDSTGWHVYNTDNSAIPDNHIRSVNKDLLDTLWIGTPGGLCKWDGADYWYTYTTDNSTLKSSNIPAIFVDDDNTKFLGSINGGLSTYKDGSIEYYRTENSGITDNTVLSIAEDASGNKWLATTFGGLCIVTPSFVFLGFTPFTSGIPDLEVNDVAIDTNNTGVLAMFAFGLSTFDNTNWMHYDTANSDLPENSLNCVAVDHANNIWIGTENAGVVIFNRALYNPILTEQTVRIQVFPNPCSDYLYVTSNMFPAVLTITNMIGEVVLQREQVSLSGVLDVTNIPAGNYALTLSSNDSYITKHFLILR